MQNSEYKIMKKYSIKIVNSINFEKLQKQKEFEDRIKEIYDIKYNQKLLDRKKTYFRTVKFLLKNKLNRDVTDEEVFQEMIRMRDAQLYRPQPNQKLREMLTNLYGPMTEEEYQSRENIFYQYKTRFKKDNPDITDEDVIEYLEKSVAGEIRRGKDRNELLRSSFQDIYGDLTEEEYARKANLFYQYKRRLINQNPETTDNDVLDYMRRIEDRKKERESRRFSYNKYKNILKFAQKLDSMGNYKLADIWVNFLLD